VGSSGPGGNRQTKRILVIDDDAATRDAICNALALPYPYEIVAAAGGREALTRIDREHFDLVVCDIIMEGVDGLEVVRHIRERQADLPIIVISGGGRIGASDYLRVGIAFGAQKSMTKPLRVGELRDAVATLVGAEAY